MQLSLPIADCQRPAGTIENSPQFQLREQMVKNQSPAGAAGICKNFLSSLRDLTTLLQLPAVKTAGYYRSSLRDDWIHAPKLQIQPAIGNRQSSI